MADALRSLLLVPALSEEALRRGLESRADAVVFDLAGGVPEDLKDRARRRLSRFLSGRAVTERPVFLRVNGPRSGRMEADVRETHSPAVDSYLLPGVKNASDVERLMGLLDAVSEPDEQLDAVPVIGDVEALDNTREIAGAFGVDRLAISRLDLINDLNGGWDGQGTTTRHAVSKFILDCRRADVASPIDSAWPRRGDPEGLRRAAAASSRMGFQGKLVLVENQVAAVNTAFSADEKEVVRAQKIVDAYDGLSMEDEIPVTAEGFLVDRAVYEYARNTLRREGLL